MFADACRVIRYLCGDLVPRTGDLRCPSSCIDSQSGSLRFTRNRQKQMLTAQLSKIFPSGNEPCHNSCSRTIWCIRTIHTLGKRRIWRKCAMTYIGESYSAGRERRTFTDAVYSPLILFLNAVAGRHQCCLRRPETRRSLVVVRHVRGKICRSHNYIS